MCGTLHNIVKIRNFLHSGASCTQLALVIRSKESLGPEFEIDPDFQGRGRVEVEGRIFRVDESEIEGRGSKVEGRNIFEIIF